MAFQFNLEQLRKQAKERVRARRRAGEEVTLAQVQFELARELGFHSWPRLKAYVERFGLEQPFRTDLDYYEGRADGIATVERVTPPRRARACRAARLCELGRAARARRRRCERRDPPTPFVLAYRAVEDGDRDALDGCSTASRPRRAARDERQRSARDGRWVGDRLAAARAGRRPEPRQRLWLDEAPPGGLRERLRARAADARRRRRAPTCPRAATAGRR